MIMSEMCRYKLFMKYFIQSYRIFALVAISMAALAILAGDLGFSQTPSGTKISVQATGKYTYKNVPFSVPSPVVTVTVGSLANFEVHYSVADSNVIFNDVVKLWIGFTNI